jgi:hypothetical protein
MLESALCDEKGFARDFENCLIEAYQKKGYWTSQYLLDTK